MGIPPEMRREIERQQPEGRVSARFNTFPSALAEIEDAAYNRRMSRADYVGRAAAAFAVFDSHGEIVWNQLMDLEPPIEDLLLGGHRKRRERGHGHDLWQIARLR